MGNNIKKLGKGEVKKLYDIGEKLGTGSFAVVKKAVRKSDGQVFAVKIVDKTRLNEDELSVVHDEVEIMYKVDHPNCVKLLEIFESHKKLYMVMELLTGGELFDRIVKKGSYSEQEASGLMRSLCSAIMYLHERGVVHRDLKPENLLYANASDDSPVKITDFGLAKFKPDLSKSVMTTACGTPGYVAPEVLRGQPYGPEVDMWSLGVILYILLCGFPPFYHENTQQLYKQIKEARYEFPDPYWTDISAGAKNLVTGLLTVNPKQRLTPAQVLAHPWVSGVSVSSKNLIGAVHQLKRHVARNTLRQAIILVLAATRVVRQVGLQLKLQTVAKKS